MPNAVTLPLRTGSLLCLVSVALCISCSAQAPCSGAKLPAQRAICADAVLRETSDALAAAYRTDLDRLPSEAIGELRVDELQWLTWAQEVCRAGEPGVTDAALAACLRQPYADRLRSLRNAVSIRDGVIFLTRTVYLALIWEQTQLDSGARFVGYDTLIGSWPEAQTTNAAWAAWNRSVLEATQAIAHAQGTQPSGVLTSEWKDVIAAGNDAEATTRILDVADGRVTTHTEIVMMRGAHPSEAYGNTTWLLAEGRPLMASDVLGPSTAWQAALSTSCWKQLKVSPGAGWIYANVNGPDAEPLRKLVSDTGNWHLEHDGLHVAYPEYAVAPKAAHPNDCVVPWDELRPVFASGFRIPSE